MGYTHRYSYACLDPAFRSAWPHMVADAILIVQRVQAAGVVLESGEGIPPVSAEGILFTGSVADELDGEPFGISPTLDRLPPFMYDEHGIVRMFCKTERFPYDAAVCATLLRCHLLAPEVFLIDSDGDWDQEWATGTGWPPAEGLSARGLVAELFGNSPTASPFTNTRTGPSGIS